MKVLQTLFVLNKVSFDEMWTYVKYRKGEKRTSIWIWTAILHVKNKKFKLFFVGDRDVESLKSFISKMPKFNRSFSDDWTAYHTLFKHSKSHKFGKGNETNLNESLHSNIRHYLARFKRNTLSYSKSTEMISLSLALFFIDKKLI
jgi:insertion element IS1 protein InsB